MTSFQKWLTEALVHDPTASARALKAWMESNHPETFWKEKSENDLIELFAAGDKLASEMQTNVNNPNEKILEILKDYEQKKSFALHWFGILQKLREVLEVGETIDTAVSDLAKMLQSEDFVEWREDENTPKESIFKTQMDKAALMDIYLKKKKDDGTSRISISCSMAGKLRAKFKDGKLISFKIK